MRRRIVVLGAGFGGLELSTILSEALGDQLDLTLMDRSDAFVFGSSKLDVMWPLTRKRVVSHPTVGRMTPTYWSLHWVLTTISLPPGAD